MKKPCILIPDWCWELSWGSGSGKELAKNCPNVTANQHPNSFINNFGNGWNHSLNLGVYLWNHWCWYILNCVPSYLQIRYYKNSIESNKMYWIWRWRLMMPMLMMHIRKLFEATSESIWSEQSLLDGKTVTDSPDSQSSVGPYSFPIRPFCLKAFCPARFCYVFTFYTKFVFPAADWRVLSKSWGLSKFSGN